LALPALFAVVALALQSFRALPLRFLQLSFVAVAAGLVVLPAAEAAIGLASSSAPATDARIIRAFMVCLSM
jgi:hypothetical protein